MIELLVLDPRKQIAKMHIGAHLCAQGHVINVVISDPNREGTRKKAYFHEIFFNTKIIVC